MQPNEQGRFCASCQKTVVDYTALSDQELVRLLGKVSETSCGRVRSDQLDRPLALSKPGIASTWRHWLGLITMGLFGWQTARAQVKPVIKPAPPTSVRPAFTIAELPARQSVSPPTALSIDGRVLFMDSSGRQSPVPQAYVSVTESGKVWQIQTDSLGNYTLTIPAALQPARLTVRAYAPVRLLGTTTFNVSPSTCSVALQDIILQEPEPPRTISGGGLVITKAPSRWQKLKRKLVN